MHKKKKVFINGAITPDFIAQSIAHHSVKTNIGAHSIFLGQVRADEVESNQVTAIEYTTHETMAEEKLFQIREKHACIFTIVWEKLRLEKFVCLCSLLQNTEK